MPKSGRRILFFVLLAVQGCAHTQEPSPGLWPFSAPKVSASEAPGCKAMMDQYCKSLYSPEARGNLQVKHGQSSVEILQGETPNQLSQVYYKYARAKLRRRKILPADFVSVLESSRYFGKLDEFLRRPPRESMSLSQRLRYDRIDSELGSSWSSALQETVLRRAAKKVPGFHKIPDSLITPELAVEKRRIRRQLITEISRGLWQEDRNWKKVEETFINLRGSFLHLIDRLDFPESLRQEWRQRILDVRLVLPGSLPAIADTECSATNNNAFYYTHLNVLTVCAGEFNSEDIVLTLSHEMAHALDLGRSVYLAKARSPLGSKISSLRESVCSQKSFSCEEWRNFKQGFSESLLTLRSFNPELPDFNRCLKKQWANRAPDDEEIARAAKNAITERFSRLANSDSFLRITKRELPFIDGKMRKNRNYLNPCSYYLWSQGEEPIDDELTTLLFFTAEHQCEGTGKPGAERMRDAIEMAKVMSLKLLNETLSMEGEFSGSSVLESEGLSSSPDERFADVIGSYATAEFLAEITDVEDRRNRLLASNSWQCSSPSLAARFPDESSVEKALVLDAHTDGELRRIETFSKPIRSAVACKKDFEFKECRLPFRY